MIFMKKKIFIKTANWRISRENFNGAVFYYK